MIILNLKTYPRTLEKSLSFVEVAHEVTEDTDVRIIVCPPAIFLKEARELFEGIFAQHTDVNDPGAHTGEIPAEALKSIKIRGSLLNHSERKLELSVVKKTIERLAAHGLESVACAATPEEVSTIASYDPTAIAVEPPELIGSGISVSKARPEIVTESVARIARVNTKIIPLCGAGVSNKDDVKKALELGSKGVLLASAFVNAKDPKKFLEELVSVF